MPAIRGNLMNVHYYTVMFENKPGFEGTEKNRCGDSAQKATQHQNVENGKMLGHARTTVNNTKKQTVRSSSAKKEPEYRN